MPGKDRARFGGGRGVLPPHAATVRATVAAHSDLQNRGPPAKRDVGEAADDSSSGDTLLTALVAPVVWIEHAAFENRAVGVDRLSSHGQAEPVELTERIETGRSEGSVGHVEVFQMVSVRTSIIGRPRCLSPDRRAHTAIDRYTLICEEPANPANSGVH